MNNIRQDMRKKIRNLLFGIFIILFFMFGIAPLIDKTPYARIITEFIEDRSIDATALYYTEIEEFSEAAINMQNSMDYTPKGFE